MRDERQQMLNKLAQIRYRWVQHSRRVVFVALAAFEHTPQLLEQLPSSRSLFSDIRRDGWL